MTPYLDTCLWLSIEIYRYISLSTEIYRYLSLSIAIYRYLSKQSVEWVHGILKVWLVP